MPRHGYETISPQADARKVSTAIRGPLKRTVTVAGGAEEKLKENLDNIIYI